jgi:Tol biopolymer transport system component
VAALLIIGGTNGAIIPAASATPPGINGRISFMRHDSAGHWQIWTANPDVTAEHQLTHGPFDNALATWSPDGTRLAFNSTRADTAETGAVSDIFVMNSDGSGVTKLTTSTNWSEAPAWSPAGDLVAFLSIDANPARTGLYVVRPDGTGLRQLTAVPIGPDRSVFHASPRFSPDGHSLVYTVARSGKDVPGGYRGEVKALYIGAVDGSNPRQITPWGINPDDPDWSPDGKHIVFETIIDHLGHTNRLMMVDPDGSNLHDLTKDHGTTGIGRFDALRIEQSFNPVWSPDGATILFSHFELTETGQFLLGLQTIHPDGSGQQWISSGSEHQADWGTAPLQ